MLTDNDQHMQDNVFCGTLGNYDWLSVSQQQLFECLIVLNEHVHLNHKMFSHECEILHKNLLTYIQYLTLCVIFNRLQRRTSMKSPPPQALPPPATEPETSFILINSSSAQGVFTWHCTAVCITGKQDLKYGTIALTDLCHIGSSENSIFQLMLRHSDHNSKSFHYKPFIPAQLCS